MRFKKSDRLTLVFALSLILMSFFAAVEPFAKKSADVRENTLRLHVVANSDSEEDQKNKLAVRDEILERYALALSAGKSIESAVYVTERLTDDMTLAAEETLRAAGCEDRVKVSVEEMYFDSIDYDGKVMPAGNYKALRIVIGEGKGHNWWCVMYPALCIPTVSKESESEDEMRIRELNSEVNFKAKLAVVEVWERAKRALDTL